MKKFSFILLGVVFLRISLFAQYPDLPGGGGSYNLQTLPSGSYVIAMDNRNQGSGTGSFTATINNRNFTYTSGSATITASTNTTGILVGMTITGQGAIPSGATVIAVTPTTVTMSAAATANGSNKALDFGYITYSGADFNLKAYGLLVHLLNNNVKLKWVIKPGKAKDAVDFSVNASRVKPSAGTAQVYDFAAGPFVIFKDDTTGVAALVQSFNGSASTDDVKMYRTNAPVQVDVRYDYVLNNSVWKPKAAIMDDGGNAQIHEAYMVNAGVPTTNYSVETAPTLIFGCFTFASEPHNSNAPNNVIQSISDFVHFGGNFLAECAAARTYENSPLARFQSVNGFPDENGGANSNPVLSNTDMAYFQINGYFGMEDEGGSLKSWTNKSPKNGYHVHTSNTVNGDTYTNASVAKVVPAGNLGGMVFYLGSHSYDGTADYDINGQRLYLNAFLVPTNPQGTLQTAAVLNCGAAPNNLVVNVGSSQGAAQAYPLTFTLYQDNAPAGFGPEDVQKGNVVTMTGPNTYQGANVITTPSPTVATNYITAIRPALPCFQIRYLQAVCSPPLPVSLLTFTAMRNSSLVNLKWATGSESNSAGFNIERSLGNGSWEFIGYVPSRATNGYSSDRLDYAFVDQNNYKGVSQYRLRQMDLDNNGRYSEVRIVRGENEKGSILVYPNPSDGKINIVFDNSQAHRDISVNDMSGRTVRLIKNITTNSISIDNLAPGMYTVRVMNSETGDQAVEKVVVNKR
jgi:hypothetical protein